MAAAGSPAAATSSCPCACSPACSAACSSSSCSAPSMPASSTSSASSSRCAHPAPSPATWPKPAKPTGWSTPSPPSAEPQQVLDYLGRYTHRVAISNHRLLRITEHTVSFRWKDYRNHRPHSVMQPHRRGVLPPLPAARFARGAAAYSPLRAAWQPPRPHPARSLPGAARSGSHPQPPAQARLPRPLRAAHRALAAPLSGLWPRPDASRPQLPTRGAAAHEPARYLVMTTRRAHTQLQSSRKQLRSAARHAVAALQPKQPNRRRFPAIYPAHRSPRALSARFDATETACLPRSAATDPPAAHSIPIARTRLRAV